MSKKPADRASSAAPVRIDGGLARLWDNPSALRVIADLLAVATLLAALAAGVAWLIRQPAFALHAVEIDAPLVAVQADDIAGVVSHQLAGTFFTLDLARLRGGLERLPWVRRAELRRVWPGRLRVHVEEHIALARWNDRGFVNTHGEWFDARADKLALPAFRGPEDMATEITVQYATFKLLLAPLKRVPSEVSVSARRAWRMKLDDGLTIELGRDSIETRLTRFVANYERSVARVPQRVEAVDLRYSNGFALRVPGLPALAPDAPASHAGKARRTG